AIWRATVTSDSGWQHSFTFLKLSPAAIWEGSDRPEPFAGTIFPEASAPEAAVSVPATDDPPPTAPQPAEIIASDSNLPRKERDELDGLLDLLKDTDLQSTPVVEASPNSEASAKTTVPTSPAEPASTPSGEHFMEWLRTGIHS